MNLLYFNCNKILYYNLGIRALKKHIIIYFSLYIFSKMTLILYTSIFDDTDIIFNWIWNCLPKKIKKAQTVSTFRSPIKKFNVKTYGRSICRKWWFFTEIKLWFFIHQVFVFCCCFFFTYFLLLGEDYLGIVCIFVLYFICFYVNVFGLFCYTLLLVLSPT